MQSRESPFSCIGVKLPTLRDIGKIPHLNDKLIRFAKGIPLIVLINTINTFVGILLLGPVVTFFTIYTFIRVVGTDVGYCGKTEKYIKIFLVI